MERWAPVRERPRRRAGQPSFSSTLLDAICDSLDEHPGGGTAAAPAATMAGPGSAMKQQEAALHYCYYYKPSLAASHRAAPAPAPADDCSGRGYFSSSEIESSLRRLRPIRTSGVASVAPAEKHQHQQQPATEKTRRSARKPSTASARGGGGFRRPASPGARLAGLINAIFSGKRHSARQHPAPEPDEDSLACSTTAPPSTARPCLANKTPPPSARAARPRPSRSRSRTVRFLDIDGEVAVAAAAAGRRRVPVVEVEEDSEKSSDASSDLFELENLAAIGTRSGGAHFRRACGDELPVYGTTGVGLRHDISRRRPFGHGSHSRSPARCLLRCSTPLQPPLARLWCGRRPLSWLNASPSSPPLGLT
ncbi:hypothetical protein HU200_023696 [Digitaria exilis]|uniref:Uncharacterized protein n=1 Tax=Digitaria exilis TaxID=1010633 RepID=A0A835C891_9POAL|nr:hypothetical protein HU200_023696 [Digitaria exilis]